MRKVIRYFWLRSWDPFDPHIVHMVIRTGSIGAVGSALVLCTEGPGFEPLMEHMNMYVALV